MLHCSMKASQWVKQVRSDRRAGIGYPGRMAPAQHPAIVVLAGGEGRRIGGGKPLRRLGGETLIGRALARARLWSDAVAIAVRESSGGYPAKVPLLVDDPEIDGPLAGIASALRHAAAIGRESVLTLPCDTPFLPGDLPERLEAAIGAAGAALAASGGALHPTCALWRSEAASSLDAYLAGGGRSIRGFAGCIGYGTAEWSAEPVDPFFNINAPADLELAEAWLGKRAIAS
jgi:molybdopterin-guanine dinucleotide biosynthesis protein A